MPLNGGKCICIDGNVEIMVQYCQQLPYGYTYCSICYLLLGMAWKEMNNNLKKLANFSKLFLCISVSEEIAKNGFIVCSSLKKSVNIFLPALYEQFHLREEVPP